MINLVILGVVPSWRGLDKLIAVFYFVWGNKKASWCVDGIFVLNDKTDFPPSIVLNQLRLKL